MPSSRIAYLTAIDFGPGAVSGVGDAARELGIKRPLLVADKGVQAAGLVGKSPGGRAPRAGSSGIRDDS